MFTPILPDKDAMYRDALSQWQQSARDPLQPETAESIQRARDYQLAERAKHLEAVFGDDTRTFDRLFLQFFREDPRILSVMTARCCARGLSRATKGVH